MLAQQVSSKLLRKVSMKMKEKGVTVGMEEIFREGPYIVFQLRVSHVDTVVLTHTLKVISGLVQWLVTSLGKDFQRTTEKEYCKSWIE